MSKRNGQEVPSEPQMVASIMAWYARCSDSEKQAARTWYTDQAHIVHNWAVEYAPFMKCDIPTAFDRIIGAIAVTSPRFNWDSQIHHFPRLLRAFAEGKSCADVPGVPCFKANRRKMDEVLAGNYTRFQGRKVESFRANLHGNCVAVTVDSWACYIAAYPGKDPRNHYDQIESAYQTAAILAGETAASMQAITWEKARSTMGKVPGF